MGSPFDCRRGDDAEPVENGSGANSAPRRPIRILVADDQPVVRQGLAAALSAQRDFSVVGEAAEGGQALRLARSLAPDVLLLDHCLRGRSSAEVMRELHDSGATHVCHSIVFTAAIERTEILALVKHGMRGLILKSSPIDLICKGIRKVCRGEVWIPRHLIHHLVDALAGVPGEEHGSPAGHFGLTTREREILQRVLEADTNKGIAERLSMSEDTVKHHLTKIFDKTGASNRLELALFAIHHHLLT